MIPLPHDIPSIRDKEPDSIMRVTTMTSLARRLRRHLLPLTVLTASCLFVVACGTRSSSDGGAPAGETKVWKLSLVKYEDLRQTEDAEKGLLAGLRDLGLEEGKHFTVSIRSAQGDIPTVNSLIDAVNTDGTDLLVSLQTATLHTAIKRTRQLPIVFMVVAYPFVVSDVGVNDTIHHPYVTGVYTQTTFDTMIEHIRTAMPKVKRLGTLFSTSELNSVYYKSQLHAACNKAGIELETFGVNARADVSQAVQALCTKNIDAICQIEDNLTSATFQTITQAATRSNLPVFSFENSQIRKGASLVYAPDYYESARSAAGMIARIMKGEKPEAIPFERITRFHLRINATAATQVGLVIPASLREAADEVIEN